MRHGRQNIAGLRGDQRSDTAQMGYVACVRVGLGHLLEEHMTDRLAVGDHVIGRHTGDGWG